MCLTPEFPYDHAPLHSTNVTMNMFVPLDRCVLVQHIYPEITESVFKCVLNLNLYVRPSITTTVPITMHTPVPLDTGVLVQKITRIH
jgi:hypothetical protein